MNLKKIVVFIIFLFVCVLVFVYFYESKRCVEGKHCSQSKERELYYLENVKIYKDTPAYELAIAVKKQNVKNIKKIVSKNPELLNYQDPVYKITLVLWSVGMEKYDSLKTLLELGADPNIASETVAVEGVKFSGETPLYRAAVFSYIDTDYKTDPKYVKVLLEYGADPNWLRIEKSTSRTYYSVPLVECGNFSFEKIKLLVENGADINYKFPNGRTALVDIIDMRFGNEYCNIIEYLIAEKHGIVGGEIDNKFSPVDSLREWVFDLDSDEYKIKKNIIEEFKRQGVDYYATPIPEDTLEYIKKEYPDTWQEYIKVY